jgi:hypothetical protein
MEGSRLNAARRCQLLHAVKNGPIGALHDKMGIKDTTVCLFGLVGLLRDCRVAGHSFAAVANKETHLNIMKIQTELCYKSVRNLRHPFVVMRG